MGGERKEKSSRSRYFTDRKRLWQRHDHASRRERAHERRGVPTGSLTLDSRSIGGVPRGRIVEIFGPDRRGKTTVALHIVRRSAEARRTAGSSTRSTRSTGIRKGARRRYRGTPRSSGQRRAGARRNGASCPFGSRRRCRCRLRCGTRSPAGDRRHDGRKPRRTSGASYVAGAPQALRHYIKDELRSDLHKPASRESRRYVRQPRNNDGRSRAEILLVGAS